MNWRINVHHAAAKQLEAIPPDRRERILADLRELALDPFRGLVKRLKGKAHKGLYRKVSGRYRIIFEPIHATRAVEVLGVFLRNERTYK
jgi:mRNA-degrading endonuclease RelE of RelBE toxin-antitoxin system